ncbi:hypothetical protein ElyMa_006567500 [Elysia marginata]|uniref:C-type lectin domain-containing protein n=1 Tax=Elysia marginata TaxID=1093978 RepID=A0AAV4IA52_9GAST|nr:hypothetical protein ElyMa_006567500 [Elysia marginata]
MRDVAESNCANFRSHISRSYNGIFNSPFMEFMEVKAKDHIGLTRDEFYWIALHKNIGTRDFYWKTQSRGDMKEVNFPSHQHQHLVKENIEMCAAMNRTSGRMFTPLDCKLKLSYICKKSPDGQYYQRERHGTYAVVVTVVIVVRIVVDVAAVAIAVIAGPAGVGQVEVAAAKTLVVVVAAGVPGEVKVVVVMVVVVVVVLIKVV